MVGFLDTLVACVACKVAQNLRTHIRDRLFPKRAANKNNCNYHRGCHNQKFRAEVQKCKRKSLQTRWLTSKRVEKQVTYMWYSNLKTRRNHVSFTSRCWFSNLAGSLDILLVRVACKVLQNLWIYIREIFQNEAPKSNNCNHHRGCHNQNFRAKVQKCKTKSPQTRRLTSKRVKNKQHICGTLLQLFGSPEFVSEVKYYLKQSCSSGCTSFTSGS